MRKVLGEMHILVCVIDKKLYNNQANNSTDCFLNLFTVTNGVSVVNKHMTLRSREEENAVFIML